MTRAVDEACSATHTPVCTGVVLDGTEGTCTVAGDCVYTEQVIEVMEACAATAEDTCPTADLTGDYMFGLVDMTGHEESCAAVARDACATADISDPAVGTCVGPANEIPATCAGTSDGGEACDLDPTTDGTGECPAGCTSAAEYVPACDVDPTTDSTGSCPVGCSFTPSTSQTTCEAAAPDLINTCLYTAEVIEV